MWKNKSSPRIIYSFVCYYLITLLRNDQEELLAAAGRSPQVKQRPGVSAELLLTLSPVQVLLVLCLCSSICCSSLCRL